MRAPDEPVSNQSGQQYTLTATDGKRIITASCTVPKEQYR